MSDNPTEPDDTGQKQTKQHLFKPGQSGNPSGRPKGARNKLSEEFLADLYEDWKAGGIEALKAARESKPEIYCKMVASLLPKEITVKNELSEFTDEQLAALGALAASLLGDAAGLGDEDRAGESPEARH